MILSSEAITKIFHFSPPPQSRPPPFEFLCTPLNSCSLTYFVKSWLPLPPSTYALDLNIFRNFKTIAWRNQVTAACCPPNCHAPPRPPSDRSRYYRSAGDRNDCRRPLRGAPVPWALSRQQENYFYLKTRRYHAAMYDKSGDWESGRTHLGSGGRRYLS